MQSVTADVFWGEESEMEGEDEDWESLILNPITSFEDRHKKSGKDSSSPTDFLHFKDLLRPLNQKYYGARYFSRGKNAHVSSEYVHGIGSFLHFSAKKKGGWGGWVAG